MHARMTIAVTQPHNFEDAVAAVQETFVPDARAQLGNRGFLLLQNREQRQLIGISFWESEAEMQESGAPNGYYEQRMATFSEMLAGAPITTTYEVVLSEH
jgi:quinol monooxygenase YgiN